MLTSLTIPPVSSQAIIEAETNLTEQPGEKTACYFTAKLINIPNASSMPLEAAAAELMMRHAGAPGAGQLQPGAGGRPGCARTRQARLKAARQPRLPRPCRAVLYVIVCVPEAVLLVALDECVPQHGQVQGKRCLNFFTLLRASDYIHRLVAAVRTAGVTLFTLAKFVIVWRVRVVWEWGQSTAHPA